VWTGEAERNGAYFNSFGDRLPPALKRQQVALEERVAQAVGKAVEPA
jgi:hypothetical protein